MPRHISAALIDDLEDDYQYLEQHYKGVSLFIESLFRQSHFQKGHFVLRRRTTRVPRKLSNRSCSFLWTNSRNATSRSTPGPG